MREGVVSETFGMVLTPLAWLALGVGLVVLEFATGGTLVLLMFAAGAGAAALAMALGLGAWWSLVVFTAVSGAFLGVVRPIARRHMRQRQAPAHRSNVDALVGAEAVVLELVDRDSGLVKLAGETWSARLFDPHGAVVPVGARVFVAEVSGAAALVIPTELPDAPSQEPSSPVLGSPKSDSPESSSPESSSSSESSSPEPSGSWC